MDLTVNDPDLSRPEPSGQVQPGSTESQQGRPAVLDPAKRRQIAALLTVGCSRRVAARYVGCSPSTISRTAARDPAFAEELARAETHQQVELLAAIRRAAKTDRYWRAGAWLLERTNPQDFAPQKPGLFTADQVVGMFVEAIDSLREELAAGQRQRAIEKLGALLLEFDPTAPPPKNPHPKP